MKQIETENNSLDEFNKLVSIQQKREILNYDEDIFKVQKYEVKNKESEKLVPSVDKVKQTQKNQWVTINLFEQLTNHFKDKFENEYETNEYTGPLLEQIKGWAFEKYRSNFEIWEIENSNDKIFVFCYDGIVKNENVIKCPYICHIFKFDSKNKVFVSIKELFLDVLPYDFDATGERIYNRVFVNKKGVYYYQKDTKKKEEKIEEKVEEKLEDLKFTCGRNQSHELQHVTAQPSYTSYPDFYCKECQAQKYYTDGAKSCSQCDYDLCLNCASTKGIRKQKIDKNLIYKLKLFFYQFENEDKESNDPIKREEIKKQNCKFLELQDYEITLPDDLEVPLDQLDYGFIKRGRQSLSKEIQEQHIIISYLKPYAKGTDNLILIYELKNTQTPIVRFEKLTYQVVPSLTFYNYDETTNEQQYIIKTSLYNTHYKIVRNDKDIGCKTNDYFKYSSTYYGKYDWGRHHDNHIDVQEMLIELEGQSPYTQYFYVSVYGLIEFISFVDPVKITQVKQYIMKQLKISEYEGEILTIYKNNQIEYQKLEQIELNKLKDTLKSLGIEKYSDFASQRFIYDDMIIISNRMGYLDALIMIEDQQDLPIYTIGQLQKQQENNILHKEILKNFDSELENTAYQKNPCDVHINQGLINFYIHKNKKQVFTTHNQGFINGKQFNFSQDKLLIDLSQLNLENKNSFKLIKLYSEECKNLKLLKYHTSEKHAIFFFIHRDKKEKVTRPKKALKDQRKNQDPNNNEQKQINEKENPDKSKRNNEEKKQIEASLLKNNKSENRQTEDKQIESAQRENKQPENLKKQDLQAGSFEHEEMETVFIEGKEAKGVLFFIIKEIQTINIDIQMSKCLVEKGTTIFIPKNLNEIVKTVYDEDEILQYHGNSVKPLGLSNYMGFETIKDLNDPHQNYLPFMFNQKVDEDKFEPYFCVLDIDQLYKELFEEDDFDFNQPNFKLFEKTDSEYYSFSIKRSSTKSFRNVSREPEIAEKTLNYSNCINAFKILYNQQQNEPSSIKNCTRENSSMRLNVLQNRVGCQQLFSRTSNWQLKNGIYNAKYQIGSDIIFGEDTMKSIHCVEIKEYLVQFSQSKEFINLDQKIFKDAKDFNSKINFLPIQIQYLTLNQQYDKRLLNSIDEIAQNNRIIPIIDDNSRIQGSYLLLNQDIVGQIQILKMTSNIEYLTQCQNDIVFADLQKDQQVQSDVLNKLQNYLGQFVKVQWKEWNTFLKGSFQNQEYIEFTPMTLEYFEKKYGDQYFSVDQAGKNDILQKFYEEFNNSLKQNIFFYNGINLQNSDKDFQIMNSIQSPFFQANIKTSNQYCICTVQFSHDSIFNYNFDKNDLAFWQYQIVKYLICANTNKFNLKNLIKGNISVNKQSKLFQPNLINDGKCKIYFMIKENFKFSVDYINEILSMREQIGMPENFENSMISWTLNGSIEQQNQMILDFLKSMDLDNSYNLICDFVNQKTIIEFFLENKKLKEANQIVDHLIQNDINNTSLKILYFDLAQLLYFQRFNLNELINIDEQEEQLMLENAGQVQIKESFCNLEQIYIDPNLPQYGNNELICRLTESQQGIHLSKEELAEIILNEKNKNPESMKPVKLYYSYIDLKPISRNIQIKLIQGRDIDKHESLEFLKQFPQKEKIQCSHFFLAKLIYQNIDTEGFFDQSTIQYIIDIQQKIAKPFVKNLLILYAFGFVIPFIYNCISIKLITKGNQESDFHFSFRIFLYILNSITQIIFGIFESAEYQYNPGSYWLDTYNLLDFSQPILFASHLLIRIFQIDIYHSGFSNLLDCVIQIIIVIGCLSKMFQYIRYKEQFSFFVQMFNTVIKQLVEFMIAFIVFTMFFSVISLIMEVDVEGGDEDYPFLFHFTRHFFEKYRISIGDVQISKYEKKWSNKQNDQYTNLSSSIAQSIIWSCWFLNIFVNNIIMLNLLVAQVGQIYDKVMAQGKTMIYKERAELNKLVFQIYYFFGKKFQYDAIIIQRPLENLQTFEFDEFVTFSERIKLSTQKTVNKLSKELHMNLNEIKKEQQEQREKLDQILEKLKRYY